MDLASRSLLEASGPARVKLLQGMLSNDVAGRAPGQGCQAALLNAKGAWHGAARARREGRRRPGDRPRPRRAGPAGLESPPGRGPGPVRRPRRVGPRAPGPRRRGHPSGVWRRGRPPDPRPTPRRPSESRRRASCTPGTCPAGASSCTCRPGAAAAAWDALVSAGARPVGFDALDAVRVEALRPWYGSDVTEDNLLHETGLLAECHSPSKGCYVGQEVVARLESRGGNVNKALRGLRLSAPARPGQKVTVGGREVGRVTTAAVSPRLGPIALAYVHRSHFARAPPSRRAAPRPPSSRLSTREQDREDLHEDRRPRGDEPARRRARPQGPPASRRLRRRGRDEAALGAVRALAEGPLERLLSRSRGTSSRSGRSSPTPPTRSPRSAPRPRSRPRTSAGSRGRSTPARRSCPPCGRS